MTAWRLDRDGWLKRLYRPTDGAFIAAFPSHVFQEGGATYCRSLGQAEAIDAGTKLSEAEFDALAHDRHGSTLKGKL